MASRLRQTLSRLSLATAAVLAALLLAEVGLRLLAPQQLVRLRPDVWVPDDGLGWRRAGGLDTRINTGAGEVRLRTDESGHRLPAQPRPTARRRLLALGDSFVAGLQVEAEATMTELLADLLTQRLEEPTEVVNAAVSGWGPEQYLEAARRELAASSFDCFLVFLFVGNDTLVERHGSLSPRPAVPLRRLRWPRSLGRDELVAAVAYPANDLLERRSHLFVALRRALRYPLMRIGLSASMLPPVFLDPDPDSPRWEATAEVAAQIAETARGAGAEALFVLLPGAYQVLPTEGERYLRAAGLEAGAVDWHFATRRLMLHLRRHGLWVADATPTLTRAVSRGAEVYGRADTHFTAQGHAEVAAFLAPHVAAMMAPPEEP